MVTDATAVCVCMHGSTLTEVADGCDGGDGRDVRVGSDGVEVALVKTLRPLPPLLMSVFVEAD